MIPLKCDVPVDFEFTLNAVQLHPAFTVEPMSGRNGEYFIQKLILQPSGVYYVTAFGEIHLLLLDLVSYSAGLLVLIL